MTAVYVPPTLRDNEKPRRVYVIHWFKPFGRLLIWSQHQRGGGHAFYLNGRHMMYVAGCSLRPFKVYAGRAW